MITVFGIKNCDTCRAARKWLDEEGMDHRFHDFRADGIDPDTLAGWTAALGWEMLLNRRGATWRKLPNADRENIGAESAAILMLANPTLIKRPVFDLGGAFVVGFKEAEKARIREARSA
ncbi:MAG: ArsC family reductase [Alphaproteobacteria bacterium]